MEYDIECNGILNYQRLQLTAQCYKSSILHSQNFFFASVFFSQLSFFKDAILATLNTTVIHELGEEER